MSKTKCSIRSCLRTSGLFPLCAAFLDRSLVEFHHQPVCTVGRRQIPPAADERFCFELDREPLFGIICKCHSLCFFVAKESRLSRQQCRGTAHPTVFAAGSVIKP